MTKVWFKFFKKPFYGGTNIDIDLNKIIDFPPIRD